uniref:MYND-type domain-containing protein n=1 Tax=Anas platyrhynchos platyrhynchos TaxID=8840 RepID=A0A493TGT1_ANAPP
MCLGRVQDFNAEKGRHLVASQDILVLFTNADLYCHRCLKQLLASVPCRGCSYAKYCSQNCADTAWEQYHRTECSLGGLLLTLGIFHCYGKR